MRHLLVVLLVCLSLLRGDEIHALAMNGTPKYAPGFSHFDYADPDAPKGGTLKMHSIGTFDTLNPYTLKGVAADGLGLVYDTLTVQSDDEPFTQYGLVAWKMTIPEDRSWIIFHIHPKARFSDGRPVTAGDVAFSFTILTTEGSPVYQKYYADVTAVEVLDKGRVKFSFKKGATNRELPLILGQLPVLPQHYWKNRELPQDQRRGDPLRPAGQRPLYRRERPAGQIGHLPPRPRLLGEGSGGQQGAL